EAELGRRLRQAIGAGIVIGARHHHRKAVALHRARDALVVGGDVDGSRAARGGPLADAHHHRLAVQVDERLARITRRAVARRDDHYEAHATSSSGGSLRASSSSITGMPSFT